MCDEVMNFKQLLLLKGDLLETLQWKKKSEKMVNSWKKQTRIVNS